MLLIEKLKLGKRKYYDVKKYDNYIDISCFLTIRVIWIVFNRMDYKILNYAEEIKILLKQFKNSEINIGFDYKDRMTKVAFRQEKEDDSLYNDFYTISNHIIDSINEFVISKNRK